MIYLKKLDNGDYIGGYSPRRMNMYYTGEDARILDLVLKYRRRQ